MRHRHYGSSFYSGQMAGSLKSAQETLRLFFEMYRPNSVVDFGCGLGTWLRAAQELGVRKIHGFDGRHVNANMLQISEDDFTPCDLGRERPEIGMRFDLALSLEVAEHLPRARAEVFIEALTTASDVVVFSAAVPGQGGRFHVNEQFPSYWIPIFARHGYACFDALRPLIWSDHRVELWYRQNILVFSKAQQFPGARANPTDYDIIHPELWMSRGAVGKVIDRATASIKDFVSRTSPPQLVELVRRARMPR